MSPQGDFAHVLIRTDNRLMIESTCMRCGTVRLVSNHDGSRAEWEEGHTCKDDKSDSQVKTDRKHDDGF